MALIDVFDLAATPIVAFLVARDVCHLETLSKAWGDELRSLPARDRKNTGPMFSRCWRQEVDAGAIVLL